MSIVTFTIYGEPASKANSRQLVRTKTGRPMFIKSQKARNYVDTFAKQCPRLDELMTGTVEVSIDIYYASRRPDLDESVILDCMQGYIYTNDRQVKIKHIYWYLDKENPRAHISVREYATKKLHKKSPE
jgi:Holliday junction resolvase RusA-like endonuclease